MKISEKDSWPAVTEPDENSQVLPFKIPKDQDSRKFLVRANELWAAEVRGAAITNHDFEKWSKSCLVVSYFAIANDICAVV